MAKILIIDDDIDLCKRIREWLVHENFMVEVANTGGDGLEFLKSYTYDLVILDWELPDMDGISVCRTVRLSGATTPILMLSGRSQVEERITGLDTGADDYLTKPFSLKELSSRIRAVLRRPPTVPSDELKVGDLTVEVNSARVTKGDEEIHLSPKEFALLEFLMRHPGKVFSSKALLDAVWTADSNAAEDTVRTYVKTLRRKITGKDNSCPLRTVSGLGYIMDLSPDSTTH
jgi:DNA-binding response OmpR family regulator